MGSGVATLLTNKFYLIQFNSIQIINTRGKFEIEESLHRRRKKTETEKPSEVPSPGRQVFGNTQNKNTHR